MHTIFLRKIPVYSLIFRILIQHEKVKTFDGLLIEIL